MPTHSLAHGTFESNIKREDEHKRQQFPHLACHELKDIICRVVETQMGGGIHLECDEAPRHGSTAVAHPQPPFSY